MIRLNRDIVLTAIAWSALAVTALVIVLYFEFWRVDVEGTCDYVHSFGGPQPLIGQSPREFVVPCAGQRIQAKNIADGTVTRPAPTRTADSNFACREACMSFH